MYQCKENAGELGCFKGNRRSGPAIGCIAIFFLFFTINAIYADVPPQINFQGRLTDSSGNPLTGTNFNIKFLIYDVASGGSALWDETHTGISVDNGIFNVRLGEVNQLTVGLFPGATRWLAIDVEAPTDDAEMSPRTKVVSGAYAFNADMLDGRNYDDFISTRADTQSIAGTKTFSGTFNISGTFQIGGSAVTATAAELNIMDGFTGTTANLNNVVNNSEPSVANLLHRHSELVASDGSPDPVLTVDDAGNVGIGTTNPLYKLHVMGRVYIETSVQSRLSFTGDTFVYTEVIADSHAILGVWDVSSGYLPLTIPYSKVGIGTTNAVYTLTCNGEPAANGYTAWYNYSDKRLKENIKPVSDGILEKILKLKPAEFNYNDKYYDITGYSRDNRKKLYGFIAQDLQKVFPEMVDENKINDESYLDTNSTNLQIYLVKALQEQQRVISALAQRIDELKRAK